MEEKEYRKYEITFYVKEEGDDALVSSILEKNGALDIKEGTLKKMQLAYPIKKEKIVFSKTIFFDLDPQLIENVKNNLRLENKILRFMIVKAPEILEKSKEGTKPKTNSKEKSKHFESEKYFSPKASDLLTNESLEKKIEEILS